MPYTKSDYLDGDYIAPNSSSPFSTPIKIYARY